VLSEYPSSFSEEADEFIEQLGSIQDEIRIEMVVDQKDEKSTQIPFSQYAIKGLVGFQCLTKEKHLTVESMQLFFEFC
jgi:hypothetical protein